MKIERLRDTIDKDSVRVISTLLSSRTQLHCKFVCKSDQVTVGNPYTCISIYSPYLCVYHNIELPLFPYW